MNLKDLKYLVALADTGHFGRAAERSFVSQPTLSAQLKKLELYLGVKLVERQPKNVKLTEAGRQIVVHARRMLEEADQIVALGRNGTDPLSGKLKVALIPTIGPYLLPRVMQKLRKALPHLGLMLYEHRTDGLLKLLHDGEIDMGILALPAQLDGLDSRNLYREAFTVAVPNGHPLAGKSTVKVQDLKDQTLLLLEDGHCLRDQALEVCGRVEVREAGDFRATSLETLRQMVVAGLGITLLPELAVETPFGSQRGLTVLQFAKPAPLRIVGAVWRKSSTRTEAIAAVCNVLAEVMAARPPAGERPRRAKTG
jgi:LysR family transcriptional regulator, hydrogen peroxide-inducible genes activator